MWMGTTRAGAVAVAILALAAAGPAAAAAGNGIRLGGNEGRLHPFLELEGRYDTNVYFTSDKQSVADMVVHVRPGFELAVPGEVAAVELTGSLDWAQYLGLDESETSDQLSKLFGQATLGISVNRRGTIGLEIDDEFRRSQNATALVLTSAAISNFNALRVKAPWRPGGGALVLSLTGAWLLETFESYFDAPICDPATAIPGCDPAALDDLGYNELRAGGELRWRFLPRTSAVFQGGWFSRTPNDAAASDVSGVEAQAGLTGLVTPHIGMTLKGGYSTTLGGADGDFSTWLAALEVEWLATDSASVRVGYGHGLGADPGPLLFEANRVYGGGRILLAGRYALRADANWEQRTYDRFPDPATGTPVSATAAVLRVEPAFEAGIARWMSASVGYAYSKRTSDFSGAAPMVPGYEYAKSEIWLRLAFRY